MFTVIAIIAAWVAVGSFVAFRFAAAAGSTQDDAE